MNNRDFKPISIVDWILAGVGTVFIIGFFIALRFGLLLDIEPANISEEDKIIIYVVAIAFVLLYTLLIENILRWTKMFILSFGTRLHNKRHIDGYPVNESFIGYKYVEGKKTILTGIDKVNATNDMDRFEDTVWYANMEFRQREYNRILRCKRKKLNKQLRRAKKRRLEDKLEEIQIKLDINKEHIQITIDFLENINVFNKDKCIELDTSLYEIYDINPVEYDAQHLLDDSGSGAETWFERMRNSKTYDVITTWILPVAIGVSLVFFGLMYEWSLQDVLSASEKVILGLLVFYLVTKIPTTIFKAFDRFPRNILSRVQDSAYIFKKYMNRKEENKDEE